VEGLGCFATLDLFKGFCQLSLGAACKEYFTLITDTGCYTSKRMMMCMMDASAHFQAGVAEVLGELIQNEALLWIDDVLVCAKAPCKLTSLSTFVVKRLHEAGLKANRDKRYLYGLKVRYFGHAFSEDGISPGPDRVQALVDLARPVRVDELGTHAST
jgi:hypothetical protein